nr:MAG TPA: hypothetical protein [Caudoviricetes sp.]
MCLYSSFLVPPNTLYRFTPEVTDSQPMMIGKR